jgi:hypothetical protein
MLSICLLFHQMLLSGTLSSHLNGRLHLYMEHVYSLYSSGALQGRHQHIVLLKFRILGSEFRLVPLF